MSTVLTKLSKELEAISVDEEGTPEGRSQWSAKGRARKIAKIIHRLAEYLAEQVE